MISWRLYNYQDLSRDLLYLILKTRQEVFIIEQNCNYLDVDGLDEYARHLVGFKDDKIVAYMRIVDEHRLYSHISFGRILVVKEYRGLGFGMSLMHKSLELIDAPTIIMSAQSYLIEFYQKFSFEAIGSEYLEDEIPHVKMIRYA